jgi:hypothetical protein
MLTPADVDVFFGIVRPRQYLNRSSSVDLGVAPSAADLATLSGVAFRIWRRVSALEGRRRWNDDRTMAGNPRHSCHSNTAPSISTGDLAVDHHRPHPESQTEHVASCRLGQFADLRRLFSYVGSRRPPPQTSMLGMGIPYHRDLAILSLVLEERIRFCMAQGSAVACFCYEASSPLLASFHRHHHGSTLPGGPPPRPPGQRSDYVPGGRGSFSFALVLVSVSLRVERQYVDDLLF